MGIIVVLIVYVILIVVIIIVVYFVVVVGPSFVFSIVFVFRMKLGRRATAICNGTESGREEKSNSIDKGMTILLFKLIRLPRDDSATDVGE